MERCKVCGEYRGLVREGLSVTCLCFGVPCRECGRNLVHRPGTNSYDPETGRVEHWPYFAGFIPCHECRK